MNDFRSIAWFKPLQFCLAALAIIILLAACASDPESTPNPTLIPPTAESEPVEPDPSHLQLDYPSSIDWGDRFVLAVTNVGPVPYRLILADGPNCLEIKGEEKPFGTAPGLLCDVMIERILAPGEAVTVGSWDLYVCSESDCLTRKPASAGSYTVTVQATSIDEDETNQFPVRKEASFTIANIPEDAAANLISLSGNPAWVLDSGITDAQIFTGSIVSGPATLISMLVKQRGGDAMTRVKIELDCEDGLTWFFEGGLADPYPAPGMKTCGDSQEVVFDEDQNSLLINVSTDRSEPVAYTFSAEVVDP